MPDLKDKLNERLDELQRTMESNKHLTNPEEAYALTMKISFAWSVLSEEDREYVQCAQDAIDEQWKWGKP